MSGLLLLPPPPVFCQSLYPQSKMCGSREMQGRRPLHISVAREEITHKDSIPSMRASACHVHHHQEMNASSVVGPGLLIYSPRRHPAGSSCAGVGLAIVAAIQAELDESDKNNSEGSGVNCSTAAAGALSPTPSGGAPAAAQISQPIPILSWQSQQINPPLPPLDDSSTVSSKLESKLPAHQKAAAACKANGASRSSSKHKITRANQRVSNNPEDVVAASHSIFSTALSPPCNSLSSNLTLSPDFLGACFLCKRPLGPGKDIYMYRGDRAFCTTECRHQQIVVDERKERCLSSTACKANQASPIGKLGHRLGAAATVAAVG